MSFTNEEWTILNLRPPVIYHKGDILYTQGEFVDSLRLIVSGSAKNVKVTSTGDAKVTAFYLPGEIAGLEDLANGVFSGSVQATGTCAARKISLSFLEKLMASSADRRIFMRFMGEHVRQAKERYGNLKKAEAEERFIRFIYDMSVRYGSSSLPATRFTLPALWGDIASYLAITAETISRLQKRVESKGIARFENRTITILKHPHP